MEAFFPKEKAKKSTEKALNGKFILCSKIKMRPSFSADHFSPTGERGKKALGKKKKVELESNFDMQRPP